MKCNISKIFISIITTFSLILLSTSAISEEAKQDGRLLMSLSTRSSYLEFVEVLKLP